MKEIAHRFAHQYGKVEAPHIEAQILYALHFIHKGSRPEEHRRGHLAYSHIPQSSCSGSSWSLRRVAESGERMAIMVQGKIWQAKVVSVTVL